MISKLVFDYGHFVSRPSCYMKGKSLRVNENRCFQLELRQSPRRFLTTSVMARRTILYRYCDYLYCICNILLYLYYHSPDTGDIFTAQYRYEKYPLRFADICGIPGNLAIACFLPNLGMPRWQRPWLL